VSCIRSLDGGNHLLGSGDGMVGKNLLHSINNGVFGVEFKEGRLDGLCRNNNVQIVLEFNGEIDRSESRPSLSFA
jgi:hypothetical protein